MLIAVSKTIQVVSRSLKELRSIEKMFPGLLTEHDKFRLARANAKRKAKKEGVEFDSSRFKRTFTQKDLAAGSLIVPTSAGTVTDYDDDFDIVAMMDKSLDPLTGTLRDLKYDDSDLPVAKNYYDFVFNLSGANASPPWSRQMWSLLRLYGEVCPVCSHPEWYSDIEVVPKNYESKEFPEYLQFLEYGICPKCKNNKYDLIKHHGLYPYQEGVFVWGQRSGKSRTAASGAGYRQHQMLKFPKFGTLTRAMDPATPLSMTFVSLTFGKAYSLLWEPFTNMINENKWYSQLFEVLDYYGKKHGVELYARKKEFLKFFHKNLKAYPSTPHGPTLRGDTRYDAYIDELGLFPLPKGDEEEDEQSARANADEAHKSLNNSLATVQSAAADLMRQGYYHVPTGMMLGVSSPMSRRDKVMRLLGDSRSEVGKKAILGIQLPTWDVNPFLGRDAPVIALAYKRNPEKAERDFGANPPRVHSSFMGEGIITNEVFSGTRNSHSLQPIVQNGRLSGKLRRSVSVAQPTLLAIDAGLVNNSFTFTSLYFDFNKVKTIVTTVLELIPVDGYEIDFNLVYTNIIHPLIKENNGAALLADRWNSIDILHRAQHDFPDLYVKQVTLRRRHFDSLVNIQRSNNIILPRAEMPIKEILTVEPEDYRTFFVNKPVSHLAHQMTTVRDTHPNKPPEKGEGYTDDIFRSYALGAVMIHDPKIQQILETAKTKMITEPKSPRVAAIFVPRLYR